MTLQSRRVRSVCESRCDWFRRTIIEAVLCELTRCQPVLASRCQRSNGPGELSCWQVVYSLSRLLVIKSAVCCKKLVNMR